MLTRVGAAAGVLALLMVAVPLETGAQPTVARVGVLLVGPGAATEELFDAFSAGMRELGYVEGRNVVFERRFGDNSGERLRGAAAELVRLKVDVLVTSTDQGVAAAKQQTQTIPIVMANSTDPVGTGFVKSLARPGGNITGHSGMSPELSAKRLELLKEVVPGLARVAVLWNPEIRGAVLDYRETENAARSLNLVLQSIEVTRVADLDRAMSAATAGRAQALVVPPISPMAYANRAEIAAFAQRNRLPTMFGTRTYAEAGGLIAYGHNVLAQWRRAATYVDKILKGARPADLPVEQPRTFELVINLKTARALGLTIPPAVLRRADHLIE
jgi:putative ABC transport system substrate-binding protein